MMQLILKQLTAGGGSWARFMVGPKCRRRLYDLVYRHDTHMFELAVIMVMRVIDRPLGFRPSVQTAYLAAFY